MRSRDPCASRFQRCLRFMARVALAAEKLDHHPSGAMSQPVDITFRKSTHDAGGLTELDVTLAQQTDAVAA